MLLRSGISNPDARLVRLMGVAAHKFLADVATDAYEFCRQRQEASAKAKREKGLSDKDNREVLPVEDLAAAAESYGISMKKPLYYPR